MAELVGAFGVSHAPLIARDWERFPAPLRERLRGNYLAVAERVRRTRPDVLIAIAPDHWTNFFLDNLPTVCIGVGERHGGPPEPFLAGFPHRDLAGHPAFALHLAETALASDFEPSISHRMALDHGFTLPLWKMELEPLPAIVPLALNSLEPPMPTISRCVAWGKLLARAVATYPAPLRVAIMASGGLSHSIGEPTMGAIDEEWDARCIAAFASGDEDRLAAFLDATLATSGNGTHEVRNWVVAHAACAGRGFELVAYEAVREVFVGCGWAHWNL